MQPEDAGGIVDWFCGAVVSPAKVRKKLDRERLHEKDGQRRTEPFVVQRTSFLHRDLRSLARHNR